MAPFPHIASFVALAGAAALSIGAAAELPQSPEFVIHTPDTTGMPGQGAVMFARFGPDGRLWVCSNTSGQLWQYGGVGIFNGDTWETHSSRNTPLAMWTYGVDWQSDGTAWVACEDRLVSYDGETWTAYDGSNSPLTGDRNWGVAITPDDHVWVANDDIGYVIGGLYEFDGTTWTHHDEPFMNTHFGESIPIVVYARSNGEVWANFDFMPGTAKYSNGTWTHQAGPAVLGFAEGPDGTLYGVNGLGTYRYDDKTSTWTTIGPYTSIAIAVDTQGRVYVGDEQGTMRYDEGSWSYFADAPSGTRMIEIAANGDVWTTHHHSVRQHDSAGNGLHIYSSVITGVPDFILDNIERDNDGNLWFCSGLAGASRYDGARYRNFSRFGHEEVNPFQVGSSLLCTHVDDVFHDSRGDIWLAANGIARGSNDLETWQLWYWGNSSVGSIGTVAIGEDINGTMWAGTDGYGIYRQTGNDWQLMELATSYNGQRVREIITTDDGIMWVATYLAVHRWDGQSWTVIPGNSGFIPGQPRDMSAAPGGQLWVASTGGLSHYSNGTWEVFGTWNSPMDFNNASCVATRPDGVVAVVTENGSNWPYDGDLSLFDGTEWVSYDYGESENPFWQVKGLEFDNDGHLWAGEVNYGAVQVLVGGNVTPPLPGDANGDGTVNVDDLLAIITSWGSCTGCAADMNGDGVVGVDDLVMVILNWS